jgi:hypothetical protein
LIPKLFDFRASTINVIAPDHNETSTRGCARAANRSQPIQPEKEMEYSLAQYWLAEAEEWKEFRDLSAPFIGSIANRSSDLANSKNL